MSGFIGKLLKDKNDNILIQFFRYAIVGGTAAVVDISVFNIIANVFEKNHIFANTISFILGLLVNYFMSRNWVFNKSKNNFLKDFTLFTVVGFIGLVLSNIIMYLLIDMRLIYSVLTFPDEKLIKLSAKLVTVFIVLFWNFIGRKMVIGKMQTTK